MMKQTEQMSEQTGPASAWARRPWHEIVDRKGTRRRQRVVPFPMALVAILTPFLAAWAAGQANGATGPDESAADSLAIRELPAPLVFLGRDVRVPEQAGTYVDIWASPKGWEAAALQRRGYAGSR